MRFHVPDTEMRLFATDSGRRLLLVQAFFMSRCLYHALLPQISVSVFPSLAHLSCPRYSNVSICHRFWLETTPCASFFHVPVSIFCRSATDLSRIQIVRRPFTCQRDRNALPSHNFCSEYSLRASHLHVNEAEMSSSAIK